MPTVYLEGRCRCCGRRVTVQRENTDHARDAGRCGPVETEHPFGVSDEPTGDQWIRLAPGGRDESLLRSAELTVRRALPPHRTS